MNNKKILGLDLGTNSIGWAVINAETTEDNKQKLTGMSWICLNPIVFRRKTGKFFETSGKMKRISVTEFSSDFPNTGIGC